MPPAIKTVLFDLGNVLVYFSHERMCQQLADACRVDLESIRSALVDEGLQWDFERGRLTETEFHQRLEERFSRRLPFEEVRHAGSDIFWRNESIEPLVRTLKQQSLRLVLLSNTCVSHIDHIRRNFTVLEHFDAEVLSCEVGSAKPEPEIYQAALAAAGCDAQECLYADDLPANVEAGQKAGFRSVLFTDAAMLTEAFRRHGVPV